MMAAALSWRSGSYVFTHHSIEMVSPFLDNSSLDESDKFCKKTTVLLIFFLVPVEAVELFEFLGVLFQAKPAFFWFEMPRANIQGLQL